MYLRFGNVCIGTLNMKFAWFGVFDGHNPYRVSFGVSLVSEFIIIDSATTWPRCGRCYSSTVSFRSSWKWTWTWLRLYCGDYTSLVLLDSVIRPVLYCWAWQVLNTRVQIFVDMKTFVVIFVVHCSEEWRTSQRTVSHGLRNTSLDLTVGPVVILNISNCPFCWGF